MSEAKNFWTVVCTGKKVANPAMAPYQSIYCRLPGMLGLEAWPRPRGLSRPKFCGLGLGLEGPGLGLEAGVEVTIIIIIMILIY